jgi:hypothetical protein
MRPQVMTLGMKIGHDYFWMISEQENIITFVTNAVPRTKSVTNAIKFFFSEIIS